MKKLVFNLIFSLALMVGVVLSVRGVSAQQPTIITGKLLGHDGKALLKAHVHLVRPNQSNPLTSVEVAKDGSFKLTTTETGLFIVQFTGANHLRHEVPLWIEQPLNVKLDVRLGTYEYVNDFSGVKIIGDFNDFSFQSAKPMEKQPDGTYTAEFETKAEKFSYQLLGVTKSGSSINGTQSEELVYDGGGDYRSAVTPKNSRVRIIFDPKKLVRAGVTAQVHFSDANSRMVKFALIYADRLKRQKAFQEAVNAHKRAGRPMYEFSYDWSADLASLSKQIAEEKDPWLRQAWLLSYLNLGYGVYGAKLDAALCQQALANLPPTSPLWSIEPDLIGVAIKYAGQAEKYAEYVRQVINNHPDPLVKRIAKTRYAPDRKIMVGKMVPAFSFVSLDGQATIYTNERLRGKIYLIDFWATWCIPCIEEMENLHRIYEKYKGRGFEILSLSLDDRPETVNKFRKGKWKMPWLNSFVVGGFDSEVVKQFEISGIPKPILVDRTGKIIAMETDLRGPNLDKTLAWMLGEDK